MCFSMFFYKLSQFFFQVCMCVCVFCVFFLVTTSTVDCLVKLFSKMLCNMSSGM